MTVLLTGDCLGLLPGIPERSVDAVVTDPPYGLSFMGKTWDHGVPGVLYWAGVLRVLKPGGYLLAFGGTRTHHRLTCAIEDAGFEIRDCLMWLHGQGFPKGKGCLKPGWEPIVLARKPGPRPWLNVDGCRISAEPLRERKAGFNDSAIYGTGSEGFTYEPNGAGRWPANVVLSHEDGCREVGTKRVSSSTASPKSGGFGGGIFGSGAPDLIGGGYGTETVTAWECVEQCAVRLLDLQSGERPVGKVSGGGKRFGRATFAQDAYSLSMTQAAGGYGDTGGASRFFYCAKASPAERNAGMPDGQTNQHPTVKPLSLMSWLVKLVTPDGGTILDPFMGSGTTGCAAAQLGFQFIGIDTDPESVATAERRIAYWRVHAPTAVSARPAYGRTGRGRSSSPAGSLQLPLEIPERAAHG